LALHDIDHRRLQQLLESGLVHPLARVALAIGLDQVIGARQAADMAGEDMIVTVAHAECSKAVILALF
jgi:hypothetical protein